MKRKNKKDYIYAVGRRKTSSARVRLFRGKGENMVNNQPIDKYFSRPNDEVIWKKPFQVVDMLNKFFVTVKVVGGGKRGQIEATTHGIARALEKADKSLRAPLKKAGLLKRDPRGRERRKVDTGGKARRKKQSPKR